MKLLSAEQIRALDAHTIRYEPITSLKLMERASTAFVNHLLPHIDKKQNIIVCCGKGNNGGDGLVITRLLVKKGFRATALLAFGNEKGSPDFEKNKAALRKLKPTAIRNYTPADEKNDVPENTVFIDALLGTGFTGELREPLHGLVQWINRLQCPVYSVDIPSGLPADPEFLSGNETAVFASCSFTFHLPKKTMLVGAGRKHCGEIRVLDIGLDTEFHERLPASEFLLIPEEIAHLLKKRNPADAKWTYGHSLLIAGSSEKPGAAMLATRACIRSGSGLTTLWADNRSCELSVAHSPELMIHPLSEEFPPTRFISRFSAVGIGPGLGTGPEAESRVRWVLHQAACAVVLDADALNIVAHNKTWLAVSPQEKILTPHMREFYRLTGCNEKSTETKIATSLRQLAGNNNCVIILKSANTRICTPAGNIYYNYTGNPGLAKGGSGDVLTGILTGLLAQGYTTTEAAVLGVVLHGIAADLALRAQSVETLVATDVTNALGSAFKTLRDFENNL